MNSKRSYQMRLSDQKQWIRTLIFVSEVLLSVIMLEVIVGNGGRWISIGPLTPRMIMALAVFVLSFPVVIYYARELFTFLHIKLLLVFFVYLAISSVIGYFNRNSLRVIFGDWTSFYMLFLVPIVTLIAIQEQAIKQRIKTISTVIVIGAGILTLFTIGYHFIYQSVPQASRIVLEKALSDLQFGGVALLGDSIARVYLRSQIFIPIAIFILLASLIQTKSRQWIKIVVLGVLYFGLLLTFTRSYWIATFVAFVILLVLNRHQYKRLFKVFAISILPFLILQGASQLVYHENATLVGFQRIVLSYTPTNENPGLVDNPNDNPANQSESDSLRNQLKSYLFNAIGKSPIVGHGAGYVVAESRPQGWTEYFYFDLVAKYGIIGCVSFLSFLLSLIYPLVVNRKQRYMDVALTTMSILMVVSYFNPYLNNAIGLPALLYVVFIAASTQNRQIQVIETL